MATAGLLALLDDIATLLDDISILTKVAAAKTAGVVGDDLALNAHQLTGIASKREIPVVLEVARGSLVNKAILIPAALAISSFAPLAAAPLLMIGGLYLCMEGAEKILHRGQAKDRHPALKQVNDPVAYEKRKIRGAVRTDFVLSAEIVIITLGTVANADFMSRLGVLCVISAVMTVGVYGIVAAIVKLDDTGLALCARKNVFSRWAGRILLNAAPQLMKILSVLGTAAMFLIGGGIILHGLPPVEAVLHDFLPASPVALGSFLALLMAGGSGILAGLAATALFQGLKKLIPRAKKSKG